MNTVTEQFKDTAQTADEFASLLGKNSNLVFQDDSDFAGLLDTTKFMQIQRAARMYAESEFVPDSFRGKIANCAVAIQMAIRLDIDPMMLMQKMYIVHGRPSVEAQLKIALVNARGPFATNIDWRVSGEGKTRCWTAFAKYPDGREVSFDVDWEMVEAEGWDKPKENKKTGYKQTSKWTTLAEKMGRYRSAAYLIDLYCPGVVMGLPTSDELHESLDAIDSDLTEKPKISQPRARKQKEHVNTETGEVTHEEIKVPDWEIDPPVPGTPQKKPAEKAAEPVAPPATQETKPEPPKTAEPLPANAVLATPGMRKILRVKLANNNISESDFEMGFGKAIEQLFSTDINAAIEFASKGA